MPDRYLCRQTDKAEEEEVVKVCFDIAAALAVVLASNFAGLDLSLSIFLTANLVMA